MGFDECFIAGVAMLLLANIINSFGEAIMKWLLEHIEAVVYFFAAILCFLFIYGIFDATKGGGIGVLAFIMSLLVFLLFLAVCLWFHYVYTSLKMHSTSSEENKAVDKEILILLTAVLIPFIVSAAALLQVYGEMAKGGFASVSTIASIIILFALVLIAGFAFTEMAENRFEIKRTLIGHNEWYRFFLAFAEPKHGEPPISQSLTDLFKSWEGLYRNEEIAKEHATQNLIGTLLDTYFKEERDDVSGRLEKREVPDAVWPFKETDEINPTPDGEPSPVIFMSTNVGFYAHFLKEATKNFVGRHIDGDKVMCMGVITHVLPVHWWVWPESKEKWTEYKPITEYRKAQAEFIEKGGLIFRELLLKGDGWEDSKPCPLYSKEDMKTTNALYQGGEGGEGITVEIYKKTESSAITMYEKKSEDHAVECPGMPIKEEYLKLMHGEKNDKGKTSYHEIEKSLLESSFWDEKPGFNGCVDIMFFGTCKNGETNIWQSGNADWSLALLATMSPNSETMFLTVVWKKDFLGKLAEKINAAMVRLGSGNQLTCEVDPKNGTAG